MTQTSVAGIKIPPYFDIPAPNDTNVYIFKVQGDEIYSYVICMGTSMARELERLVGDLGPENRVIEK
jgi:hypothetical protein